MLTAYRFPEVGGKLDRRDAEVLIGWAPVLRLSYGDATDLYRINLGWANQQGHQPPGFNLDLERGLLLAQSGRCPGSGRRAELMRGCDSQLERRWLKRVEALKLRLRAMGST